MLKFAKFIGANTDFATAQAFLFPRAYSAESNDPVFGLVILGRGDDVFVFIRQKILDLEENFNAPFERVTDKLHELLEKLKEEFKTVENLQFTLFCAKENIFYVLQTGKNLVEILSGEVRSPIIQNEFSQEKIISGFIKTGDRILVLSTKTDNAPWGDEIVSQIFTTPMASVQDLEVIFAKDEKEEDEQDLAGVKNIQPVAFILIENEAENAPKEVNETPVPQMQNLAKKQFKLNINFENILLSARKAIRQVFGVLRQTNKKVLISAVVLIIVTTASLAGYSYIKVKESEKNTRRDNLITLVESGLLRADSLKDQDTKSAIAEISSVTEKLKELESLDPENPKVKETKSKFEQKSDEILKIYKNFDLELFMSLDLIRQNFLAKKMSFSVNKILLLDEVEKSLVSIGIELKSPDILAGSQQLGDAKLAAINGSNAFAYSPDKGITNVDLDTEKVSTVSAPDALWGEIKDIFGFSDNLYVLDSGNPPAGGMIWKYAPIQTGFSQKQEYLRSEANLTLGKELMIDYSVWVLTSEPDVLKFTAGSSDFYAISGIDKPLTQIDGIYVTEELDCVFLLDKLNSRILVTKKNGEYLAQYVKPELSKVDDFFIDEEGKSIYLLIENKIFKTPLR